jgi:hypothetical protein
MSDDKKLSSATAGHKTTDNEKSAKVESKVFMREKLTTATHSKDRRLNFFKESMVYLLH